MQNNEFKFIVNTEITGLGIKVVGVVVNGVKNEKENPEFNSFRQKLLEDLIRKYTKSNIKEDPIIHGFCELHNKIGYSNKKYIASPESMLGILLRYERFPSINLVVDIYNCISLETRLSLGAHDLEKVHGNITFRIASGTEHFLQLGKTEGIMVKTGEYCYIDDSNEVICRLECHQSEKTKIDLGTRNCFFIVQGNEHTSNEYILSTTYKLVNQIKKYCGGQETRFFVYTN